VLRALILDACGQLKSRHDGESELSFQQCCETCPHTLAVHAESRQRLHASHAQERFRKYEEDEGTDTFSSAVVKCQRERSEESTHGDGSTHRAYVTGQ
jgi:hypothetical protein